MNNIWQLIPYHQIGDFKFGEARNVIREKMGQDYSSKTNTLGGKFISNTDYYPNPDIKFSFNEDDQLTAVEFFEQNLVLEALTFSEMSYKEIMEYLMKLDTEVEKSSEDIISKRLGVGFGRPDNINSSPTYAIVFKENYYEESKVNEVTQEDILKDLLGQDYEL
ncbi:MAG: hypothetical protein H6581_25485 [Bacteroidia bacterium]|nr:hypothetical protein [Bacteroidia bacterium]